MVNSCGDKTDGCVDGGRREPKSTAGASGRDEFGERREATKGRNVGSAPSGKISNRKYSP